MSEEIRCFGCGAIIQSDDEKKSNREISENDARKVAKKQFEALGEAKIKTDELKVQQIRRSGEEYYYISSKENTLEIRIKYGKITRLNSVSVE